MSTDRLPKSRLNQIAQRKLETLGVRATLSADEQKLEGVLQLRPGQIINPLTHVSIERARFVCEGHDHLRFLDPAMMAALPPQPFYEFPTLDAFIASVDASVKRRVHSLKQVGARLRNFGLAISVDTTRAQVRVQVDLHSMLGSVILEGDDRGLFAIEVIPSTSFGARRDPIPLGRVPIEFARFGDRTDLELLLSNIAEAALANPPEAKPIELDFEDSAAVAETGDLELQVAADTASAASDPTPAPPPMSVMPPPGSLTLGLLVEKLGVRAQLGAGVALVREISIGKKRLRFEAKHVQGLTFFGRASADGKELWSERFDLEGFPGLERFGQILLGEAKEEGAPAGEFDQIQAVIEQLPKPGQIWAMHVVVESEEGDEIRYVPLNADGQPYGAARVLKAAHFKSAFQQYEGGYRILVEVITSDQQNVTYARFDPESGQLGDAKVLPLLGFIAQFVPGATGG